MKSTGFLIGKEKLKKRNNNGHKYKSNKKMLQ